ncbi:hypothetical protein [Flavihumibacter petaseus]|uniref:Outer membrane lipoprotein-sorting protein n=1 Tax=Flavihumibacter petaseus NBRC 106054 TaxID=1220578 RepID=A0A0E9N459_9BACT|nr:hypothetical protein [Flavihumibacter petaseus]GAO44441.1 hypothetical protein FPE01S_03_04780 [Flavihumibacter petaseus NBRC 106054]
MRTYLKLKLVLLILVIMTGSLQAQQAQYMRELKSAAAVFLDTGYLHVDLVYKYSNEATPLQIEDSLRGSIKIWGKRFWYALSNTEATCDDSVAVIVFKEDQLLYLTRPSGQHLLQQQFSLLDSLSDGRFQSAISVSADGRQRKYVVKFLNPQYYKELEFWTDNKGRLVKTRQLLHRRLLDANAPIDGVAGNWVFVEVSFLHVNRNDFNPADFDTQKLVRKEQNGWVAQAPYQHYSVFKANPSL